MDGLIGTLMAAGGGGGMHRNGTKRFLKRMTRPDASVGERVSLPATLLRLPRIEVALSSCESAIRLADDEVADGKTDLTFFRKKVTLDKFKILVKYARDLRDAPTIGELKALAASPPPAHEKALARAGQKRHYKTGSRLVRACLEARARELIMRGPSTAIVKEEEEEEDAKL